MKTTTIKKNKTKFNEPRQDKFIEKILENLSKVNANDWEKYTNLNGSILRF